MADFLLELLTEEIPARMQAGARAELEKLFRAQMGDAGVDVGEVTVWSTPRRLALIAKGLPTETQPVSDEAKGPPVGAPDQAVDGFCRKTGVTRDELEVREVKGRETYFAVIEKPGQAVSDLLANAIPYIITQFSWPKSMRWGAASITSESLRWVRPLSGIVALLDGDVVEFELPSHADVYSDDSGNLEFKKVDIGLRSGRTTRGHRFHSSGLIEISGADAYAGNLREASVIVDHEERAAIIREGARKAAENAGLKLVEDEGLVIENAGLTEWPEPLLGRFDESYLDVPPEVIQLTARVNQKYFVCEDADGKLANAFICTANIDAVDPTVVVDGNRKVLAARLSDARFFWELDQKTPLAEHAKGLERITFHEKLGTVADKVERVAKLARWLCEEGIIKPSPQVGRGLGEGASEASASSVAPHPPTPSPEGERERLADLAEQAARLCKADLVTEMVGEFPELQGLMGGYYAEKEGLPHEVAHAIRDHYKPVGQGDEVPTAPVTVAVSLADKLDTLFGFFAIKERPTGSKDPFALRRAAISIYKLLATNALRLSLVNVYLTSIGESVVARKLSPKSESISMAIQSIGQAFSGRPGLDLIEALQKAVPKQLELSQEEHAAALIEFAKPVVEVRDFLLERVEVALKEEGLRTDVVRASVIIDGDRAKEDDLVRLLARVKALQGFIETDNGVNLLAGYKRAANILKKENHVTPAQAGVQTATSELDRADGPSATPGLRRNDDGIDGLGEEDPLALAGKPEFDAAFTDAPLSYTPEPAEKDVIDALDAAEPKATAALEAEDFEAAMSALATLRAPIDRFFEDVIVNAEEKDVRAARLNLLARFRDAVHRVADFSRIEG